MDSSVKERLEMELRADAVTFANRMHTAAEKLSASIPPGKGGLVHVQQLFLGAFWLKSAERWTEAWHALGVVIRAANEIGISEAHPTTCTLEADVANLSRPPSGLPIRGYVRVRS